MILGIKKAHPNGCAYKNTTDYSVVLNVLVIIYL